MGTARSRFHPSELAPGQRRRRPRTRYLVAHAFEGAVGFAAVLGGVVYFIDPHSLLEASIGRGLGGLIGVWSVLYFLGGVGILWGLVRPSLRIELVGLCLYMPAVLTNGVAVTLIAGAKGVPYAATFVAVAVAVVVRARAVWELAVEANRARDEK